MRKRYTFVAMVLHRDESKPQEMDRGKELDMQKYILQQYQIGLGYHKGYKESDNAYALFVDGTDMTLTRFFVRKVEVV